MSRIRLLVAAPMVAAAVVVVAAPAGATTHPGIWLPGIRAFTSPAASGTGITLSNLLVSGDELNGASCAMVAGHPFCMAAGTSGTTSTARGIDMGSAGAGWSLMNNLAAPPLKDKAVLPVAASCAPSATTAACMAVGGHLGSSGNPAPLAEVLTGGTWNIVASYNIPGVQASLLTGVSCPTSSFCMITGEAVTSSGLQATVHTWSNGKWSLIAPPAVPAGTFSELTGVSCVSAASCEAVGLRGTAQGTATYGAAWAGGTWQMQAMPSSAGSLPSIPFAVSCTATPTAMCMATGVTLGQHLGTFAEIYAPATPGAAPTWQTLTTPARPHVDALLTSVSCPTATACFGSGTSGNYGLLEEWNSGNWHILRDGVTSRPTGTVLPAISCLSVTNCVAAGDRFPIKGKGKIQTLVEVWSGTGWSVKGTPNP